MQRNRVSPDFLKAAIAALREDGVLDRDLRNAIADYLSQQIKRPVGRPPKFPDPLLREFNRAHIERAIRDWTRIFKQKRMTAPVTKAREKVMEMYRISDESMLKRILKGPRSK